MQQTKGIKLGRPKLAMFVNFCGEETVVKIKWQLVLEHNIVLEKLDKKHCLNLGKIIISRIYLFSL